MTDRHRLVNGENRMTLWAIQEAGGKKRGPLQNSPLSPGNRFNILIGTGLALSTMSWLISNRYTLSRVEDDMRPLVKAAVQSSNTTVRNAVKAEQKKNLSKKTQNATDNKKISQTAPTLLVPVANPDKHANNAKEFLTHSSSAPRRLNDIAQAPPEFKRLPRGAVSSNPGVGGKLDGVISMAQKQLMEKEREKAIARYRELKSRQRFQTDGGN